MELIPFLTEFLKNSPTSYHAQENAKAHLLEKGFQRLAWREDWELCEGGKYFVERSGSLIAFTVGGLDNFSYKITASHTDSPMLKLKESPAVKSGVGVSLNVETYGGGIWYSLFDRPLKIAGRIVKNENGRIVSKTVEAPFLVSIPSLAVHMNRGVNEGFAINPQVDLLPLCSLNPDITNTEILEKITGETGVLSYDLFAVNADMPYSFGLENEFFASPRIDNLTSVCASLSALVSCAESDGICVAAFLDHEEIGSATAQGADGSFLENALKRIAYALRFDENEYYKALASSFLLSVDNAHALHPNHAEKSDPTNKTKMGGGVVIKSHANGAYITDGVSSALFKSVLEKAGVKYQTFFNRSDMRSGSTLGVAAAKKLGVSGVDLGLAQLAMHSACECFAKADYEELVNGLTAFYSSDILAEDDGFVLG